MVRTPLELVRLTAAFLEERGVPNPRLDAEVLLAHVLGVERIQLYLQFDRPLTEEEIGAYREVVRRRGRREPVGYIRGFREFWSLPFAVDRRVLVPRPETEILVGACLERMGAAGVLADLGIGSGAIALSLLVERPEWRGVGVDRSEPALEVAALNARGLGVEDRLVLCSGDLCCPLDGDRFDLMVSNPPYVPSAEIPGLEPEVSDNEPREALDGGPDGLSVIRRIVRESKGRLKPGGLLAFEFGVGQEKAVREALGIRGGLRDIQIVNDYAGRPRVALAVEAEDLS